MSNHPSDGLNSETESTEQTIFSVTPPQAYVSPSDVKEEYNRQKLMASACIYL